MLYTSMINMGLRAVTLASKFILVLFMSKYMSLADIGTYGLFTISSTLLLNFVGFNFFAFNSRELLNSAKAKHGAMVRDQAVFHLLAYLCTLPLIPLIFKFEILDWSLLGWLYAILILEHICQELERLLITFSHPIKANLVLFIRSAAWVYVLIGMYFYFASVISLSQIWQHWLIAAALAIIFGIWQLRFIDFRKVRQTPINFNWILKGFKSASYLFGATMLYQAILFFDRVILQHFHGEQAVGIYTFYWSVSNAIYTFVYAGVISILHPEIISTFSKRTAEFDDLIKKLFRQSSGLFIIIFIILWFALDYLLLFTDKPQLAENKNLFMLSSLALFLMVMTTAFHYRLYCSKHDKTIFYLMLGATSLDLLGNVILTPTYASYGTAGSITLSMLLLAALRLWFSRILK